MNPTTSTGTPHSDSPYRNQVRLITSCRRISNSRCFGFGIRQKGISFLLGVFSALTVPQIFELLQVALIYLWPQKPKNPETTQSQYLFKTKTIGTKTNNFPECSRPGGFQFQCKLHFLPHEQIGFFVEIHLVGGSEALKKNNMVIRLQYPFEMK